MFILRRGFPLEQARILLRVKLSTHIHPHLYLLRVKFSTQIYPHLYLLRAKLSTHLYPRLYPNDKPEASEAGRLLAHIVTV